MRRKTTRPQVSGEIWHDKKYQQAAVRGLGTAKDDYPSFGLFGLSSVVVLLGLGFAFVSSMLNPSPEQGDNSILVTQEGGLFVKYDDRLHPVTNMASARLIVGSPDKASMVKTASLAGMARGPLMGIPSGPATLDAFTDDSAAWGVCTYQSPGSSLSLTESSLLQTTLVAGRDTWTKADTLDDGAAVIVAPSDTPDERWLLFKNRRAQLDPDDSATLAALGIDPDEIDNPVTVSDALLDAIGVLPVLTSPELARMGENSPAVRGHSIGDVLVARDAQGEQTFYAVTDSGVQRVSSLVADLLINRGGKRSEVDTSEVVKYPTSDTIDTSNYPAQAPAITRPASVCYSWARPVDGEKAATHIVVGDNLPITAQASDSIQRLLPDRRGSSTFADFYASRGGKGWFVTITGDSEVTAQQGQLAFISDTGVLFPLVPDETYSYDDVAAALGLSEIKPLPLPDSFAQMFPRGADLSVRSALVEHVDIPVDLVEEQAPTQPSAPTSPRPTPRDETESETTTSAPTTPDETDDEPDDEPENML